MKNKLKTWWNSRGQHDISALILTSIIPVLFFGTILIGESYKKEINEFHNSTESTREDLQPLVVGGVALFIFINLVSGLKKL